MVTITLCWSISIFLSSADFFFHFKINFIWNSLDPDQTWHFLGADMGPDYLQWITEADVELMNVCIYINQNVSSILFSLMP